VERGRRGRPVPSLLQAGYAYVPYSSLESLEEQSKEAYYYLALRQTQGTIPTEAPNWQPWLLFFLRSLAEQVRRLNRKIERENLVLAALVRKPATSCTRKPRSPLGERRMMRPSPCAARHQTSLTLWPDPQSLQHRVADVSVRQHFSQQFGQAHPAASHRFFKRVRQG
jgi:hypothetical protein